MCICVQWRCESDREQQSQQIRALWMNLLLGLMISSLHQTCSSLDAFAFAFALKRWRIWRAAPRSSCLFFFFPQCILKLAAGKLLVIMGSHVGEGVRQWAVYDNGGGDEGRGKKRMRVSLRWKTGGTRNGIWANILRLFLLINWYH